MNTLAVEVALVVTAALAAAGLAALGGGKTRLAGLVFVVCLLALVPLAAQFRHGFSAVSTPEPAVGGQAEAATTTPQVAGDVTSSTSPASPRPPVTLLLSFIDDRAAVYINDRLAAQGKWGVGAAGESLGHLQGESGPVDVTRWLHPGKNHIRFAVYNDLPGHVSARFSLRAGDRVLLSDSLFKAEKALGLLYDRQYELSLD